MSTYYHLFLLCNVHDVSICEVVTYSCQVLTFKRTLTEIFLLEFNKLCFMVQRISLSSMCSVTMEIL
jgi:hypothetical protein